MLTLGGEREAAAARVSGSGLTGEEERQRVTVSEGGRMKVILVI